MYRRDFTSAVAAVPVELTQHAAADVRVPMEAVAVDVVVMQATEATGGAN